MIKLLSLPLALVFQLLFFYSAIAQSQDSTKVERVQEIMQQMSVEQKVGQLFLFGFNGTTRQEGLNQIIKELTPGGIVFFSRNIKTARQTSQLIFQSQVLSETRSLVPMFTAIDQEGGFVSRIKLNPPFPSALSIALTNDTVLTDRMGYYTGLLLSSLGFNMNLAPVVDLVEGEAKSFIGNRAFGNSLESVTEMSHAFARGMRMANVMPTFKHFPGHGATFSDSHLTKPIRNETLETLLNTDLVPYKNLDKFHPAAIMAAHISFPKIEPKLLPVSLSSVFLKDILRKKLGFDGLVVTDDIEMKGADDSAPLNERAVKSFLAGSDVIMIAWNKHAQKSSYQSMLNAVKSGVISTERLNESVKRILMAKADLGLLEGIPTPKLRTYRSLILSRSISDLSYRIIETLFDRSLESIEKKFNLASDDSFLVFSSRNAFHNYFKQRYRFSSKHFGLSAITKQNIEKQFRQNPRSHGVLYITSQQLANISGSLQPHIKSRLFLINGFGPGVINKPESFAHVHNIYTTDARLGFVFGNWLSEKVSPPMNLREPAHY